MSQIEKPTFTNWFTDTYTDKGDQLAEKLHYNLTKDLEIDFPEIDWDSLKIPDDLLEAINKPVKLLTEEDLTTRLPQGTGMFDALMESCKNHLKEDFIKSRLVGSEFTKAYIASMQYSMQFAVQYLTSQEGFYWQNVAAKLAAIKALIEIYTLRIRLYSEKVSAFMVRVNYANAKLNLAATQEQLKRVREEMETARAQTLDTRTDDQTVEGAVGKQKDMQDAQIKAFEWNAQSKYIQMYVDAYNTRTTVDEGTMPPDEFTMNNLNSILMTGRDNVNL